MTRTARYAMLGEAAARPRELWLACHGYRQLAARFARDLRPLDDGSRWLVAPEALSRFYLDDDGGPHGPDARVGATWMTREDRLAEIADYVGYLDALHDSLAARAGDGVATIALGFSQGAQTAARWAALGRARIAALVLWAAGAPHDLDLAGASARLREMRVLLVSGESDAFFPPAAAERQCARFEEQGVSCEVVAFPGGHAMDAAALQEVAARISAGGSTTSATSPR